MARDTHRTAGTFAEKVAGECLALRVGRLHRLVSRHFTQALRSEGLTVPQMEVLTRLAVEGAPMKPAELAGSLGVERSTTSRNLAIMTEEGWIAPSQTSASGRAMSVEITAAGREKLVAARAVWTGAQRTMVARLGPGAASTLDTWLRALD